MRSIRRFANAMIIFGVLLLVGATILMMYNIDQDGDVGKATGKVMAALSDGIAGRTGDLPQSEDEAIAMREAGTDVVMIDGRAYIGYLSVPSQSLDLPILAEWSYPNLKIAPCCYSGAVFSDDLVLAGHNYRSHFGKLNNLSVGDEIRFTNAFGVTTVYTVQELQVLHPTSVEKMKDSEFDLSLFTCNMSGNARFTVRCNRAG